MYLLLILTEMEIWIWQVLQLMTIRLHGMKIQMVKEPWKSLIVTTNAGEAASVFAADIDGDGDMDLASASYNDNKIAWYENTDGKGTFGSQQIVTTNAGGARSVFAADIDGDGDMDLARACHIGDKITWYENTDGKGTFGGQLLASTSAGSTVSLFAADIDGDGVWMCKCLFV